jgi:sortase A
MKNSTGKIFVALIVVGVALASAGIWFGFLSGYLKAMNDTEQAQQLFVTQAPAPASVETTMTPEPIVLADGVPKWGQVFAVMRITSLGPDWVRTISEGTSLGILDRLGVGHYEDTEFPGEPGNFAVAGHSGNKWTPFAKYQDVKPGDFIQVETYDSNFTYKVVETVTVDETDMETVYENPSLKSDTKGKSWLTITTCVTDGPENKRIAIFAELVSSAAKI